MKKRSLYVLVFLFVSVVFSSITIAQEIIDVPPSWGDGDTDNVLSRFISADTTNGGERKHPDAIYRLKRGEYYEINPSLRIDYNFTLIGETEPASTRPAMVIKGVDAQGAYVGSFFNVVGDSADLTFKDIIFQGVGDDNQITTRLLTFMNISGNYHKLLIDNCVFNGITGRLIFAPESDKSSFIFKNSNFRNSVPLSNFFSGTIFRGRNKTAHQDTMLFINNTFFNIHDRVLISFAYTDYIEFSHNTFLSGMVKSLQMNWQHNVVVKNNIFYDYQMVGTLDEYKGYDGDLQSIVKLYPSVPEQLLEYNYTESDRKHVYKNNVYAWSQQLKQFWDDYVPEASNYYNAPAHLIEWMCDSTRINFFENTDMYPLFVDENNDSLNPGFPQDIIDSVLAKQLPYLEIFRVKGYSNLGEAKERFYAPGGNFFELPWPLPENLAYTNQAVLTHAEGGFPAGDLNWFPDKKAEWEEWITDIKKDDTPSSSLPMEYTLSQNYPNPFNPTTEMSFSIPVSGITTLTIYNVLGQKVVSLVNEELSAGSYVYTFDARNLTSGIYFYELQSNNYSQVKKMILMK